jgi:hypothetical protein
MVLVGAEMPIVGDKRCRGPGDHWEALSSQEAGSRAVGPREGGGMAQKPVSG